MTQYPYQNWLNKKGKYKKYFHDRSFEFYSSQKSVLENLFDKFN